MSASRTRIEYGDFQTPRPLAREVCRALRRQGVQPASVLEPNCGLGNFLLAALEIFPDAKHFLGVELNPAYVESAKDRLSKTARSDKARIIQGDFFAMDWERVLADLEEPLLILGNPPWVTNAALGRLNSANVPLKSNFQNHRGIEAITGAANFDISEWMLIQELHWLQNRRGTMAMLVKTSVARKVLVHAWKNDLQMAGASMRLIDASTHFGVTVDACLLVVTSDGASRTKECAVYASLDDPIPRTTIGFRDGRLVADLRAYEQFKHLQGREWYRWRSGIKHDAAKIMELRSYGDKFLNGLNEIVDLERDYLYPMLKGSEVANAKQTPERWMLAPQRTMGADTREIQLTAPKTWRYLLDHASWLDKRKSSIYRNRPRFSIFGVGDYTFAPWKVAIPALYKRLKFVVVGPYQGKPVVFDDTCYFLACRSQEEAEFLADLLNSDPARGFFSAFIFWDAKRPITIKLLKRLDLFKLAQELGQGARFLQFAQTLLQKESTSTQLTLPL